MVSSMQYIRHRGTDFVTAKAALSPSSSTTTSSAFAENHDGLVDDDHFVHSRYYPHEGNSTIQTSVTIHVTPEHYHLLNWVILWSGFLFAIALASFQIRMDNKWFASKEKERRGEESGTVIGMEGNISIADRTRGQFRRFLLVALVSRTVMIPVQLWSKPIWAQFVADTLPDMAFASAWTLLVSFFVQLSSLATGFGRHGAINPGMVLQVTAYILYITVLATYFVNPVASVLLYALLCCIYAALCGTSLYFCPRLLMLLRPNLVPFSALAIRLVSCCTLCCAMLAAQTIGFARKVIAPPATVSWWWQYGILELIPSILFLLMMIPKSVEGKDGSGTNKSSMDSDDDASKGFNILRNRSTSPSSGLKVPSRAASPSVHDEHKIIPSGRRETVPLLKPTAGYGSAANGGDVSR